MLDALYDHNPWPAIVLGAIQVVVASATTCHIVLNKREVRAAIGWTGLVWLSPVAGVVAYWILGVNRIQRRALRKKLGESWRGRTAIPWTADEREQYDSLSHIHPPMATLERVGKYQARRMITPGNQVDVLEDGDRAYPAMLEAIDGAQRSISLLSYIFKSDRVGHRFLEALARARERGVEVRVLIDGVGAKYGPNPPMPKQLKRAGIPCATFLPTRLVRAPYLNMRNHRKILVVDGRIGFTGGTNISEDHELGGNPPFPVQCLHFRLEGPVVRHLQEAFAVDWAFVTGEQLVDEAWFPELTHQGPTWARGVTHGPDEDRDKLANIILAALSVAQMRVRIATPYFLPEIGLLQALHVTALRGIDVEIFLPKRTNIRLVQWATNALLAQVFSRHCRVWLTPPPFDHTKVMVVDDLWTFFGSTNWDPRSLRLNFEFNVECYDVDLARRVNGVLDAKRKTALKLDLETLRSRPLPVRVRDGIARLASPYL